MCSWPNGVPLGIWPAQGMLPGVGTQVSFLPLTFKNQQVSYAKNAAGLAQFYRHSHPGFSAKNSVLPPPPSSLNFHLHSALQYCCSTARRKAENCVVQSTGRQLCVSAKLGLAARGRTARMLLTQPLPWGPVAHVIAKFNSHRIFFFCSLSSRMLFLVEELL